MGEIWAAKPLAHKLTSQRLGRWIWAEGKQALKVEASGLRYSSQKASSNHAELQTAEMPESDGHRAESEPRFAPHLF